MVDIVKRYAYPIGYIEHMDVLYLPIKILSQKVQYLPKPLRPFTIILSEMLEHEHQRLRELNQAIDDWDYIYLSCKAGIVSKDNTQQRPGWHVDGFGSDDETYIWSNCFPTEYIPNEHLVPHLRDVNLKDLDLSHDKAIKLFENIGNCEHNDSLLANSICRIADSIHRTPVITKDNVFRIFFKVSFSKNQYNLAGNAINYDLNYDWTYYNREALRNHPTNMDNSDGVKTHENPNDSIK